MVFGDGALANTIGIFGKSTVCVSRNGSGSDFRSSASGSTSPEKSMYVPVPTLWARVGTGTYMDFSGDVLPLADDLKSLPLPFLDTQTVDLPKIPIVFASAPSPKTIQAAGVVTSYFGMESENRPVRFPAFLGQVPAGDSVIIAENPAQLPGGLSLPNVNGPTLAVRANPSDSYSKVLIV